MSSGFDLYPFATVSQQQQFQSLLRELRCLVCQNQDLVDSNAGLAQDLRAIVYKLIQEGQSLDAIRHFLTERYGDYILFKPSVNWLTVGLWVGPWLLLVVGVWLFMRVTRYE
jgi:cytochrome c-type biogenesis protein CcmH